MKSILESRPRLRGPAREALAEQPCGDLEVDDRAYGYWGDGSRGAQAAQRPASTAWRASVRDR